MLSWAITLLIIAIIAAVLGSGGITGATTGTVKTLFVLPLVPFAISFSFRHRRGQPDVKKKAMRLIRSLVSAPLLGAVASSLAVAADKDGEYRPSKLQSANTGYRKAWQNLVKDESRLSDWVMGLSETATPVHAVDDQDDKYLVGGLCEKSDCEGQRLSTAFNWDKSYAYGLYMQVPERLPRDKSSSKHANFHWLGKPEPAAQKILDKQLEIDPNWY